MKWFAGCDHAGLPLKRYLVETLRTRGDEVVDLGTHDEASVDYPHYGAEVGERVAAEPGTLGLVVCGSGIGISIAANKVPGVRCALVHDAFTAQMARLHNDANIVSIGARQHTLGEAARLVELFLETDFSAEERHVRRLAMVAAYEETGTVPSAP